MIQENGEISKFEAAYSAGMDLSEAAADELYKNCAALFKPHLEDLVTLYGYYCSYIRTQSRIRLETAHCLNWMIKYYPESPLWRSESIFLSATKHRFLQETLIEAWQKATQNNHTNPVVFGNAGCSIITFDLPLARNYLEKAIALDESESYRHWLLINAQRPIQYTQFEPGVQDTCLFCLSHGQRFLELYKQEYDPPREKILSLCALSALLINEKILCRKYAMEQIELVKNWSNRPRSGKAILALLAIEDGNWDEAKRGLLDLTPLDIFCKEDIDLIEKLIDNACTDSVIGFLHKANELGLLKSESVIQAKQDIEAGQHRIILW